MKRFIWLLSVIISMSGCNPVAHPLSQTDDDPTPVLSHPITVLPSTPDSLAGLRSYSRVTSFIVDARGNPEPPETFRQTIGFNVRWKAIIHYDSREGMLAVLETGHTSLSATRPSSHTTVLFPIPGTTSYRNFRTYPDDPDCYVSERSASSSRFEEAFGSIDVVESFKPYYLMDAQNQMVLMPVGEVEINGIVTEHYRVDPDPTISRMREVYPDFEGTVSGDVYLAQGTSALIKASFRFEGASLPAISLPFTHGMMEGVIELTIELADLNNAPPIVLQPECANEPKP